MTVLSDFPITKKWPAQYPDRLQLYSLPTPNGIKVSAMLEETGLAYEPHKVDFATSDQTSPEFLSLNPNNKIPAIIDPDGPGGKPLALWESGAILIYLAEKTGKFLPEDPGEKYQAIQWVMWQMGGFGPMTGQLGFFHKFAGKEYEDRRPFERYRDEVKRLLKVLNAQLEGREFIMEARTIARLFLISPAALAKRLVRAKAKVRDAGIPFQIPEGAVLEERSSALFEALYALHAHARRPALRSRRETQTPLPKQRQ